MQGKLLCLPLKRKDYLTMRKLIVCFLILFTTTVHAAKPDWVKNYGRSEERPVHIYLVGFGSAWGSGAEPRQIAADGARADISRHIVTKVKSVIRTSESEMKGTLSQQYSGVTQSETALKLLGLETEAYADAGNNPTTYVLAYVSRAELKRIYTARASTLREEIRRVLADAEEAEDAAKIDIAVEKYLSTYPLYEALKEAEIVLLVAKHYSSPSDAAFDELERATKKLSHKPDVPPILSYTEVINRVEQLVSESITSVDGIARAIVFQLSKQMKQSEGKVLLTPFTYQDTRMSSPFSRQLLAALETQIGQMGKWKTVNQTRRSRGNFRPRSVQHMRDFAKEAGATLLLSGTYWENGDQITLRATLRDVETGEIKAGAVVAFDRDVKTLNFKPQNYKQMLIEQHAFAEGEFISGLQVEMWTDKGSEHLLYTKGETMKVSVRVNRAAHIRLLYILADGRRTLLYDNYYIDQSKVNRVVEIPQEFECAPPFGAELMVVAARTEVFPPIQTYESDGYHFLSAKDARQAARDFRGMKKKQKRPDVQQSEARLVLTTMRK